MKNLFIVFLIAMVSLFAGTQAIAGAATGAPVVQATTTVQAPQKAQSKFAQKAQRFAQKVMAKFYDAKADGNWVVAVLLAFFLGYLGVHRVAMGASPIIILKYLLLSFIVIGVVLAFIDFIVLLLDGDTSRFDGNNKVFAAFGAS